jgi:lipopolysaccharide heptosyltransferase II
VRLDTLGDLLMTTPALRALKERAPGVRLTLLTSTQSEEAASFIPEVDDVIVYDSPWMKATERPGGAKSDFAMVERLRGRAFDAAVIFTVYSQNPLPAALICFLAGIPLRLAHCRENPYGLLTDWLADPEPQECLRHEVRRQLDLVAAVGAAPSHEGLSFRAPMDSPGALTNLLESLGQGFPWAVLHPGATAPSRRYRTDAWAQVVRGLLELGWRLVLTGTEDERRLEREILAALPPALLPAVHGVMGRLDLAGLSGLLSTAPMLISNNTGPVHLAAAAGTPVVDLYALTNPQHAPWRVAHRTLYHDVPCKYCYKSVCPLAHNDCLQRIEPAAVVQAALELMEDRASPGRTPA